MKTKLALALSLAYLFACGVKGKPLPPLKVPYIGGAPQKSGEPEKKTK